MSRHEFTIKAKVWRYPGMAGWFFVSLPKHHSAEIKQGFGQKRRGWGSVPVMVRLGTSSWQSSIFPDTKSGTYLLPLKASVRKKEQISENDTVTLTLRIDVQRLMLNS